MTEVEVDLGSDPGEFFIVLSGMAEGRLTLELTRDELLRVLCAMADAATAAGALDRELGAALHRQLDARDTVSDPLRDTPGHGTEYAPRKLERLASLDSGAPQDRRVTVQNGCGARQV